MVKVPGERKLNSLFNYVTCLSNILIKVFNPINKHCVPAGNPSKEDST